MSTEPEVHTAVEGGLGRIILNRPAVINALNHSMIRTIDAALIEWESDARVRAVVIHGNGERGLCAGGDIRAVYDDARTGGTSALDFWADEYRLNARIARFPKPYIALMDGVVMGGGVGISAHESIRIVTERSRIGMPEVRIGFVPDIGGTYLLSRAPGQVGTHMGLTGREVSGADAIYCGLADYFVPSHRLPDLLESLEASRPMAAVAALAEPPPASGLARQSCWIDPCYEAATVEEILARLRAHGDEAADTANDIEKRSPTSLKVTLRAIRSAATLTLEAALDQEFRIASMLLHTPDLVEGIRAQIVDKDRSPRWSPATLSDVTDESVARFFQPTGNRELGLENQLQRQPL